MHKIIGLAAAALLLSSACGVTTTEPQEGGGQQGVSTEEGFKIGLLLPEVKTARYEKFDRPLMEAKLKELCAKCEVLYQNADQDEAKQRDQTESMITQGVKVLILDAVNADSAGSLVSKAKQQNIPVVAYDRLAKGPIDYYVSFDNKKVGQVQGEALLEAVSKGGDPKRGKIVMINGAPTDPNAGDFKEGAHSVLDGKVDIGQEYDTPDWSPDKAQNEMEQAITAIGRDNIIGVYAANDGTAGGAIAAMKSAKFAKLPPVTGQDAELAGIQRIVSGQQYMTVYKAIKPEAEIAAEMAIAAATGQEYKGQGEDGVLTQVNNGDTDVPSVLLPPIAVTKDNIEETVIKDGFYTVDEICTENYADDCKDAGLQ